MMTERGPIILSLNEVPIHRMRLPERC